MMLGCLSGGLKLGPRKWLTKSFPIEATMDERITGIPLCPLPHRHDVTDVSSSMKRGWTLFWAAVVQDKRPLPAAGPGRCPEHPRGPFAEIQQPPFPARFTGRGVLGPHQPE
uniref:Uncharacterized protein n=1 Tax=Sphaerodactylus townsendi TaxID=933632 RepID=A0ACB8EYS7_9SAUR